MITAKVAAAIATIACAVGVALVVLVVPAGASGASTRELAVSHGGGAVVAHGTDYVGAYKVRVGGRWLNVYCLNPTSREPGQVRLTTETRIIGHTSAVTSELAYVVDTWGQTGSTVQAEAVSQALNYLAGNRSAVTRRAHFIAKSTQARAMSYVRAAQKMHGPVSVGMHLSAAALPGQTGVGTVTVTAAGGGKISTTLRLSHSSNVSAPTTVHTNSAGVGTFRYTTMSTGEVHLTATAPAVSSLSVQMSHPARGYQRMIAAAARTSSHGSASYQGRASGFSNSYSCTSRCNGHPPVTLRACAPASRDLARLTYTWTGGGHRTVIFPASSKSVCTSVTVTPADGDRVAGAWQYYVPGRGWSAHQSAAGGFTVDCPAAPKVAVALSYDCTSAAVTAALGTAANGAIVAERNATRHAMVLVVSGAVSGRYPLAPGATATPHHWAIRCGVHSSITVTGGVQRSNGTWNYGQPATITLP